MRDGEEHLSEVSDESDKSVDASRKFDDEPAITRQQFLVWGLLIESGTLLIAVGLAYLSGQHFWRGIEYSWFDVAVGCAAAGPMLLVFWLSRDLRTVVGKMLGPALARASMAELALIALLAGVCEEALFRGVLEPWWSGGHWVVGFLWANILFGLLHAVTLTYLIMATLFGAYLSLVTWAIGEPNLLRAIVCHALYDFIAFWWLASLERKRFPAGSAS